MQLSRILETPK